MTENSIPTNNTKKFGEEISRERHRKWVSLLWKEATSYVSNMDAVSSLYAIWTISTDADEMAAGHLDCSETNSYMKNISLALSD